MSRSISIVFLKAFLTLEREKNLTKTGIFVILNNSGSRITLWLSSFPVVFRLFSYCYNSHVCHMISLDYIEKARSVFVRVAVRFQNGFGPDHRTKDHCGPVRSGPVRWSDAWCIRILFNIIRPSHVRSSMYYVRKYVLMYIHMLYNSYAHACDSNWHRNSSPHYTLRPYYQNPLSTI